MTDTVTIPAPMPAAPVTPQTLPSNAQAIAAAEAAMSARTNAQAAEATAAAAAGTEAAPTAPTAPAQDPASKRLAFLARKEREVLHQRKETRQAMTEIQQLKAELAAEREQIKAFWSGLETDPLGVLGKRGLDYDKLTQAQLTGKPADTTAMQLKALRDRQEAFEANQLKERELNLKQQQENARANVQQTIDGFKSDIVDFCGQAKDAQGNPAYELIEMNGAHDHVYETAALYFERTGKTLTVQQAADMVEDFLYKQVEKAAGLKKFQARRAAPTAPAAPAQSANRPTLTSSMTAAPTFTENEDRMPNEGEAIRRALAKMPKRA